MYDTRRRKALFEQINNRSWEALRPVIRKWVAAGSVIVTDEWKGCTAYRPKCLWPLPAGQRGSCRFRRANHRRLEKVAIEGSDGRLEVPCLWPLLAGHGRSCRLWRANHRRLGKPTKKGTDGKLKVPVAVTSRS
nr:unnamed protein product [Spirometra erinaceieuropaei]